MIGCFLVDLWDYYHEDPNSANSQDDMAGERMGIGLARSGVSDCASECLQVYPSPAPAPGGPPRQYDAMLTWFGDNAN